MRGERFSSACMLAKLAKLFESDGQVSLQQQKFQVGLSAPTPHTCSSLLFWSKIIMV